MASVTTTLRAPRLVSSTVNPTAVTQNYWVWAEPPHSIRSSQKTLGKWLVFKQFNKLDETWHTIRKTVESGELGATGAKSSTAMENPSSSDRQGSSTSSRVGVICVYTSEEAMDEVGLKLVYMVKQDIRYKTDEATHQGVYAIRGYKGVALKTIYWNDGEPSFVKKSVRKRRGKAESDSKAGISKAKVKEHYGKLL